MEIGTEDTIPRWGQISIGAFNIAGQYFDG